MHTKYIVFWLPRIYHFETHVLNKELFEISEQVSDVVDDTQHIVTIRINCSNPENRDLLIESVMTLSDGGSSQVPATLMLSYKGMNTNGMIQFSYDEASADSEEAHFICSALPNAIYHMFKSFFHNHEYHDSCSDSTLTAFISNEKVKLDDPDNPAIIHYLKEYYHKFCAFREDVYEKMQVILNGDENDETYYLNYLKRHRILEDRCRQALGEATYYEALFYSVTNESCRLEEKKNLDLQRLALNTRSAINSIRHIQETNKIHFNQKHAHYVNSMLHGLKKQNENMGKLTEASDRIGKISLGLGILSVVFGVASIIISVL